MKSILLSIRPEWAKKILNGEKTIEIRKKFPKDYVGWIYIYVAKGKPYLYNLHHNNEFYLDNLLNVINQKLNGKVCCRFWCDNVEDLMKYANVFKDKHFYDLLKDACLNTQQLQNYLGNTKSAYAIHISKLEVFDKPRELKEFNSANGFVLCRKCLWQKECCDDGSRIGSHCNSLYKAPQNFTYIESEE